MRERRFLRLAGAAFLFSGAALLAHILSGISLRLALAFTTLVLLTSLALIWRRSAPPQRDRLRRVVATGFVAGSIATIVYDASKWLLSLAAPPPFNPFEAIRVFGHLLAGTSAAPPAILAAGIAFHLLNGICFGIAFCFIFKSRSALAGIAWGLFLEFFQLTLYPGWLDIRFYREFLTVSALSHVIYGWVLAWLARNFEKYLSGTRISGTPN